MTRAWRAGDLKRLLVDIPDEWYISATQGNTGTLTVHLSDGRQIGYIDVASIRVVFFDPRTSGGVDGRT